MGKLRKTRENLPVLLGGAGGPGGGAKFRARAKSGHLWQGASSANPLVFHGITHQQKYLVGGLEHFYFSIYRE